MRQGEGLADGLARHPLVRLHRLLQGGAEGMRRCPWCKKRLWWRRMEHYVDHIDVTKLQEAMSAGLDAALKVLKP